MELWVRSQDKMLLTRAVGLRIVIEQEGASIIDETADYILGIYNTVKRALEVLDEIQRKLQPTLILNAEINTNDNDWVENGIIYQKYKDNYSIQELSTYVYEMPKE